MYDKLAIHDVFQLYAHMYTCMGRREKEGERERETERLCL